MDEREDVPDDTPEDALVTAERIDEFFAHAIEEESARYGDAGHVIAEVLQDMGQFTAVEFVQAYRSGGIYPEERLKNVVLKLTDVRLQEWYTHFDGGLVNTHYYGPIHVNPALEGSASLTLELMAIAQSMIARSSRAAALRAVSCGGAVV
jgi:hypothetical protein